MVRTNDFQFTYLNFSLIKYFKAHVAGLSSQHVKNGKVGKVIGLDPAGPLYSVSDIKSRISNDSAKYVECIHTGFWLGTRDPFCQVDFFVNGGMKQPKCKSVFGIDDVICSHIQAVRIFAESIESPRSFKGTKCGVLQRARMGTCKSDDFAFVFDEENPSKNVNGIYYVKTN